MRALTHPLEALFRIRKGEGRVVAAMMLYSVAAVGGVLTVGYGGVSQALFLSRLPPSAVPFTLILPAVAIAPAQFSNTWLAARLSLTGLAVGSSLGLTALALLFRLLVGSRYGATFAVLAAVFVFCEVGASLVIVQFWTHAGQIFDPRQARRLYGPITLAGTFASVLAGVVMAVLVHFIGVDNLLFVVAGSFAVCAGCAFILRHHLGSERLVRDAESHDGREHLSRRLGLAEIWASPLLRSIAAITVCVSLLINIGAYQFFLVLQAHYAGNGDALTTYLGLFAIWTGVAALAVQLFGTGTIMVRSGLFITQALFPVAMGATGIGMIGSRGQLWSAALVRACDPVLRRTTHETSLNALYLPVPAALRARSRSALEGLYAVAFGVAGAVFLLVQHAAPHWTVQDWSFPALGLAAVWIALLFRTRRAYRGALADSVTHRRLEFGRDVLDLAGPSTVEILRRTMQRGTESQIVYLLGLIGSAPSPAWMPEVTALLSHPSAAVRIAALGYLRQTPEFMPAHLIAGLLEDADDGVRAAAIDALFAVEGTNAAPAAAPLMEDAGPLSTSAAITGIVVYGGQHASAANERLQEVLQSPAPGDRRVGARVLGALAGNVPEAGIARVGSDGASSNPVITLVGLLQEESTAAAAADGLVRWGDQTLAPLAGVLDGSASDVATRRAAVRILRRIGSSSSAALLAAHLSEPNSAVRIEILEALSDLLAAGIHPPLNQGELKTLLLQEIHAVYRFRIAAHEVEILDPDDLLADALRHRAESGLDRIFALLELLHPGAGMGRARRAVARVDTRDRAMAVELVDSLVGRSASGLLLPLLEGKADHIGAVGAARLQIPQWNGREWLLDLAETQDPWLRACAVHVIGRLCDPSLALAVRTALADGDPLVGETARDALRRLAGDTTVSDRIPPSGTGTPDVGSGRHRPGGS